MKKKIIIIGAGPAGLTAAYELLKEKDYDPIILEESDFIGGISRTATYHGNRMDIGGHRFFSKDERVTDLWKELMPIQGSPSKDDIALDIHKELSSGGPNPEKEERVMLLRKRVSRIFYLRKFFDYPISLKFRTFKNMGFGYMGSVFHKRKEDSLENFYINRFGKPLYQMFFEDYTEKLWGVHPRNISADWGAQRVKGLSLSKAIWNVLKKPFVRNSKKQETSLIEQFLYPKKGPGQLYEIMADEIQKKGGTILLNAKVDKILLEDNKIKAVEACINGERKTFEGDAFISSMPIKDLIESIGKENCSDEVYHIATQLPYRDFITVGLLLDKLKIKNETKMKTFNNIVPDCWIYVQERDVKLGRIQVFNNWSPYMVEDFEHKIWIGLEYFCTEGDDMWNSSDEDFIKFAVNELKKIDIIEDEKDVLDATRIKVKKAYPAYFGTYQEFDKVKNYLDTIDNLYCVGRNGQHRYNNMDHSMVTAMVACELIKQGNKDKSSLWSVNTEKSYHETKEK